MGIKWLVTPTSTASQDLKALTSATAAEIKDIEARIKEKYPSFEDFNAALEREGVPVDRPSASAYVPPPPSMAPVPDLEVNAPGASVPPQPAFDLYSAASPEVSLGEQAARSFGPRFREAMGPSPSDANPYASLSLQFPTAGREPIQDRPSLPSVPIPKTTEPFPRPDWARTDWDYVPWIKKVGEILGEQHPMGGVPAEEGSTIYPPAVSPPLAQTGSLPDPNGPIRPPMSGGAAGPQPPIPGVNPPIPDAVPPGPGMGPTATPVIAAPPAVPMPGVKPPIPEAPGSMDPQISAPPIPAAPKLPPTQSDVDVVSRKLGLTQDQAENLLMFSLATMAAGGQPGATLMGSIGAGGMAALADKRARTKARSAAAVEREKLDIKRAEVIANAKMALAKLKQTASDKEAQRRLMALIAQGNQATRRQLNEIRAETERVKRLSEVAEFIQKTEESLTGGLGGQLTPEQNALLDDAIVKTWGTETDIPAVRQAWISLANASIAKARTMGGTEEQKKAVIRKIRQKLKRRLQGKR